MALEGLNVVLSQIQQTRWQEQQSLEALVRLWPELVGAVVAAQTRPTGLTSERVLKVAVSSGVWAQTLAFERIRILAKINAVWSPTLRDIHFSIRGWQQPPSSPLPTQAAFEGQPSASVTQERDPSSPPKDAQEAFARWSKVVQQRAKHARRCPLCHCPTPEAELQRWKHCALCLRSTELF